MIDNQRFEFIYCANNDDLCQESLHHLTRLKIPDGFTAGNIISKNAASIVKGYQQAMLQSRAKYKVYLHQDVNILNQNFLFDIVALFKKYPKLGLLGVLGAKRLPPNGIWWDAAQQYGKVYYFDQLNHCNTEVTGDYESVQIVDGMIMITQYDLPWRVDRFTGWHFYDASQSLEFLKAGYAVGVPRQAEPWCSHNSTSSMLPFIIYQQVFCDVYQPFLTEKDIGASQ